MEEGWKHKFPKDRVNGSRVESQVSEFVEVDVGKGQIVTQRSENVTQRSRA